MKIKLSDLWDPRGTVDRGTYALVGVLGFALKLNLDRAVAAFGFHRSWSVLNYWMPLPTISGILKLNSQDSRFLCTLVALSLPFIWVGVAMTMKRLRSAELPSSFLLLFFVPFLNLLFFLWLSLFPERHSDEAEKRGVVAPPPVPWIPSNAVGSAVVSILLTVTVGTGLAVLGTQVLQNYGWGLFVALPFAMGFSSAILYGAHQPRSLSACISVACLAVALLGAGLLAVAVEGLICVMMAAPLALPLAILGAICGYFVQRQRWTSSNAPAILGMILVFVPGLQWMEHAAKPDPPTFVVRSSIDIQAPPETVWKEVVAFTEIPPPKEWIFRSGIAYPIRAEMVGSGAGAERHCVFSTGAFVEPITVWDAPRLLKFSVTSNPAPMEELTLYTHIEPPHLRGFLESNGGQFLLTRLANGGTRLEGTTWYHHGLWPAGYWRLWSDAILHRIHMRVLQHIRLEAERKVGEGIR